MISEKINFVKLEKYEGGPLKFGDDTHTKICGKFSINFDGKHNTYDVLNFKILRHNLLSIGKLCRKGYHIMF